ncbi:patatin-like phospholipase family protein [Xanthobacter sp. TB0139]|uniref:patatin-like phospholipase family protein n=1 Tax=Xanthobacter sp. TB0139 TaxID=3459178 RepID=UPI0040391AEE
MTPCPSSPLALASNPQGPVVIGLALGGGAARGLAHLGILHVLEREGLRPHLVAGTSIGAVVGGLWAAGRLHELTEWAMQLNRRNMLGFLDFTLDGGGLIAGRRLMERMKQEVGETTLEQLPTPFTAVATECGTGREIWLTQGDFVTTIRASYALPGIFTPAHVEGRWLLDGALVNPVPVAPVRAAGADVIIAVDLNADALAHSRPTEDPAPTTEKPSSPHAEDAPGIENIGDFLNPERLRRKFLGPPRMRGNQHTLSSVILDAFTITQDRITRARLAEDPPEVLLVPRLRDIGLFDFHRTEEAMAIGAEAAEEALPRIREAVAKAAAQKPKNQN